MKKPAINYGFVKCRGGRDGGTGAVFSRGFSMVEILIVLAILCITAMMAIPMLSSAGTIQVRSAANMVAADIEYAKGLAMGRGQTFSVVFDASLEKYWIEDQSGNIILHPIKKGSNYIVDFKTDSSLSKVDIVSANFDSTESISKVSFNFLGTPYNNVGSELSSTGIVTLTASGLTITVSVEPMTGYISISN